MQDIINVVADGSTTTPPYQKYSFGGLLRSINFKVANNTVWIRFSDSENFIPYADGEGNELLAEYFSKSKNSKFIVREMEFFAPSLAPVPIIYLQCTTFEEGDKEA